MPRLDERGVPVLLPSSWLRSPARVRVNLSATSAQRGRASGFLSPTDLARFDWRVAVGDTELTERELAELAAAKEPFVRVGGRWHALRRADVEKALRFLDRRRAGAGIVELVRAVSGLETDAAGARAGRRLARRTALGPARDGRAPLPLAADARDDDARAVPLPGARARLAAPARRPRRRRDPGRRHGARQDGAGDRDARLRARGARRRRARADARRLPDERRQAVGRRDPPFRPVAPRAPPPRPQPARRRGARARRTRPRRRRHLLRHRHPRRRRPRRDRVGPAPARRGAGREEPGDEARAGAAPAAGAAPDRDDGDADREPARRALGDHGHRQSRPARLARGVRPRLRPADRAVRRRGDARAAALDRAAVRPPPRQGLAGDRAGAAADHDREGLLQAHDRAGEPLPGDRRPLAGAGGGTRGSLRAPRRRARDARPPEAGLQSPGDAADDGTAARRPLRQARAAGRAAPGRAAGRQVARLHPVPGLRPARAAPRGAPRDGASASSTGA